MKMKQNSRLFALAILIFISMPLLSIATSMTEKNVIDSLLLEKSELPEGYKLITKEMPITNQASSLYNEIDMYSMILNINAVDKRYQTFKSSKENGTVYYILFDGPAEKAKGFAEGLIWGTKEPNREHPDEIIVKGNLLILLSFQKDSLIKEMIKTNIDNKTKK
jgi:hypothetical protein